MTTTTATTALTTQKRLAAAAVLLGATMLLSGCGGSSIEGTYFGTAGDTALIVQDDGKCLYTEDYDEDDATSLDAENMDECTWTSSDKSVTFDGLTSSGNTVTGTVQDDGSISLPDQNHWNGEIYSKK